MLRKLRHFETEVIKDISKHRKPEKFGLKLNALISSCGILWNWMMQEQIAWENNRHYLALLQLVSPPNEGNQWWHHEMLAFFLRLRNNEICEICIDSLKFWNPTFETDLGKMKTSMAYWRGHQVVSRVAWKALSIWDFLCDKSCTRTLRNSHITSEKRLEVIVWSSL